MVGVAGGVMTAEEWGEYLDGLGDLGRSGERRREMEEEVAGSERVGYIDQCGVITEIVRGAYQITEEIVGPCTADGGVVAMDPTAKPCFSDDLGDRLTIIQRECRALRSQITRIRERF